MVLLPVARFAIALGAAVMSGHGVGLLSAFSGLTVHQKPVTRKGVNLPPRGKNTRKEEDVYT